MPITEVEKLEKTLSCQPELGVAVGYRLVPQASYNPNNSVFNGGNSPNSPNYTAAGYEYNNPNTQTHFSENGGNGNDENGGNFGGVFASGFGGKIGRISRPLLSWLYKGLKRCWGGLLSVMLPGVLAGDPFPELLLIKRGVAQLLIPTLHTQCRCAHQMELINLTRRCRIAVGKLPASFM